MNKSSNPFASLLVVFALLICGWFFAGEGVARNLSGGEDPFLDAIGAELEAAEIDYVPSWDGWKGALPERPALAVLRGYPSRVMLPALPSDLQRFAAGDVSHLASYHAPTTSRTSRVQFLKNWSAREGERVFMSFTRRDIHVAQTIKQILQARGHNVFIFIGENGKPDLPIEIVRSIYDSSDRWLVLHTANAQSSKGIWLERELMPRMVSKHEPQLMRVLDPPGRRHNEAERRLRRALGKVQARRIADVEREASILEAISEEVETSPEIRTKWAQLSQLAVKKTLDAVHASSSSPQQGSFEQTKPAFLTAEDRLGVRDLLRNPQETATIRIQQELLRQIVDHLERGGATFQSQLRPALRDMGHAQEYYDEQLRSLRNGIEESEPLQHALIREGFKPRDLTKILRGAQQGSSVIKAILLRMKPRL